MRRRRVHVDSATKTPLAGPLAAETCTTREVDQQRIPWVRPIFEVDERLLADIRTALLTGRVTNDGPHLRELERRLADYLGVEECVAVASGSAALDLAIGALDIGGGKAVLPSFTFIATLNALSHHGITPVFCDIEPDTWTLSASDLARVLAREPEVRLVVPVNVFGVPPDLTAIRARVEGRGVSLLLDNAHGFGTLAGEVRCPAEPAVQTFSFHATKVLPGVEGGVVVSRDRHLLAEVRRLRNHGLAGDLLASTPGYNGKMSELHALVALRSLDNLDAALERRRGYAARLRSFISLRCAPAFVVQTVPPAVRSNFQNFGVVFRSAHGHDAAAAQAMLAREGIETRRYFWPLLHHLARYRDGSSLPESERVGGGVLCLPLHSRMEESALRRIEAALERTARELG